MLKSINPANGRLVREFEQTSDREVDEALDKAVEAQADWRLLSCSDRAVPLKRAAEILRKSAEQLARLMAVEMGKPLAQGRAEAGKCAWVCEYYAEHAEQMLADEVVPTEAACSYITLRPLGTILAVMPWNFPLWQVFRCAVPALMAGNAVVLKHASNVSGCALAIAITLREAGIPDGVFTTLLVDSSRVTGLIDDPRIAGVALTGSTPAGRAVGAAAGRALKPSVLELGGSDPYIILEDADLDAAAEVCVAARLINAGQTCIAAKRFIVEEAVRAQFEQLVVERMAAQVVGDPFDPRTTVGPLARRDLRDELVVQVKRSLRKGARCLLGGEVSEGPGAYYPVTVLTDVAPGMVAHDQELFGPVAAIVPAMDAVQAIELANQSDFGLGAAIFSRDAEWAERMAVNELNAGSVFVNDSVRSDPRLPFGGVKGSGYGRELAAYGIREFVNVKTVVVRTVDEVGELE